VLGDDGLDARAQLGHQPLGVALGGETLDVYELLAQQVCDDDEGARVAYVNADDALLARVDVEEGRLAPALALARPALDDQPVGQKLVDEQRD
jgi:hypothetical protein